MKKRRHLVSSVMSLFLLATVAAGCGQDVKPQSESAPTQGSSQQAGSGTLKIGLSIDDLRLERWQHDRDIFIEKAKELGAEVDVQSANGDDATQLAHVENMLSKGVDVIVIIPHNSEAMAAAVDAASKENVPVLAYDRLITNSDVSAYVTFDNVRVGEMQAEYLTKQVPKGNYFLLGGSPTDNNAKLFRQGQMNIIKPLVDKGDIAIVGDQWAKDWQADAAMQIVENALTSTQNKIDAVVASNDSTAGGAIQALAAQGLAGKVAVSGQDADLAAVQRIVEGKQSMTVYKPIKAIATKAAEMAVQLAKGEKLEATTKMNNGKVDVPTVLLDPIQVDKDNIMDTIIKDSFHKYEDVYKNVPEDQRPKRQ
ncbi:D-xylose ABC transporter substrate-binding protein [Brevibacillus brevis]|uniref:D-xylose ABC transporter substrate-binding protein n=1 Tax=Brevibacillus brevis TaxID=1393 RepID=A0ABY9T3X5_BREBE|nr:D-xylose ABC transporter substrate-binding protein [Brevibacillus brevis]WNC14797.1 D-xylose ABC transporter substrate-binding protein [Brevibacillus brevis]